MCARIGRVMEAADWQKSWLTSHRERDESPSEWQQQSRVGVKCSGDAEQSLQVSDKVGRARCHTWPLSEEQVRRAAWTKALRLKTLCISTCVSWLFAWSFCLPLSSFQPMWYGEKLSNLMQFFWLSATKWGNEVKEMYKAITVSPFNWFWWSLLQTSRFL